MGRRTRSKKAVCPRCGETVESAEHVPFEEKLYTLHCTACPRRVAARHDDPHFWGIEESVARRLGGGGPSFFDELMEGIGAALMPCSCGGTFSPMAAPRCFECGEVLGEVPDGHTLVGPPEGYVVEAHWRPDCLPSMRPGLSDQGSRGNRPPGDNDG